MNRPISGQASSELFYKHDFKQKPELLFFEQSCVQFSDREEDGEAIGFGTIENQ